MQKIYKSNGTYALFTQLSDDCWVRGINSKNIEVALSVSYVYTSFSSEQEILDNGWTPYDHNNLEWLVEGDVVEEKNGDKRTVLGRHGIGESRLYHTSSNNFPLKGDITAHGLKENGYKRVTPAHATDTKAQEAIKYLESVGRIKAGKVISE